MESKLLPGEVRVHAQLLSLKSTFVVTVCLLILYNLLLTTCLIVGGSNIAHMKSVEKQLLKRVDRLEFVRHDQPEGHHHHEAVSHSDSDNNVSLFVNKPDIAVSVDPAGSTETIYEEDVFVVSSNKKKREVLSGAGEIFSELRGPAGPPGPPGRDGRDPLSLDSISQFVTEQAQEKVGLEWDKFSSQIPKYGGAVYVRWGRTSCSQQSKLIYQGIAAGADFRSTGGGANMQCLPLDPEYDPKYSNQVVQYNFISGVIYETNDTPKVFGPQMFRQQVPCAVCEAGGQRTAKVMIPGKLRCPNSDWTLEYKGFLTADLNTRSGTLETTFTPHHRVTYECLDETPVKFSASVPTGGGGMIRLTAPHCKGDNSINNCPPYKPNQPIQCVVCTK